MVRSTLLTPDDNVPARGAGTSQGWCDNMFKFFRFRSHPDTPIGDPVASDLVSIIYILHAAYFPRRVTCHTRYFKPI